MRGENGHAASSAGSRRWIPGQLVGGTAVSPLRNQPLPLILKLLEFAVRGEYGRTRDLMATTANTFSPKRLADYSKSALKKSGAIFLKY